MIPLFDNVPTRRLPVVTYGLIATNLAVWLWELSSRGTRIDRYAFYPCAVSGPCSGLTTGHLAWPEGVFTSMFLHASWLHVLGNMLFLWIFGNNVEDVMGRVRFLVFYLAAGYAAALTQAFVTLHYAGVGAASVPNVGRERRNRGRARGLRAAPAPRPCRHASSSASCRCRSPPSFFLGFWFLFQLWQGGFSMTHPDSGGGVAFAAHVGGFVFGALAIRLFQVRAPLRPRW